MKKIVYLRFYLLSIAWMIYGCSSVTPSDDPEEEQGMTNTATVEISDYTQKNGELTVLMDNSITSYFIYRGEPMGFEYDMLSWFAKDNGLKLNVMIIGRVENILDSLLAGKGDIVAANLTISKDRLERVSFTKPLFRTKQILVQRLPDNFRKLTYEQARKRLVRDRLDLDGKTVTVRRNTSYELTLKNLILETGINVIIDYAPADAVTEELIEMVSNKTIDYTISDQNKAIIFSSLYDNIDIETPMSLSQPIAWAVNKQSTKLLTALDQWIGQKKGTKEYNMIRNKYFEPKRRDKKRITKRVKEAKDGKLSPYDNLIKKYAGDVGWDWRLLAALIYQESKFDPETSSWRGAVGLMQLMPKTAQSYGVQPRELREPEKNIQAGVKHLARLKQQWEEKLQDSLEVIKFTLGSYNVGGGHVRDAVRLAEKYGLDPNKWDDNVAQMLINKSKPKYYNDPVVKHGYCRGREPVNYVSSIFEHYELYKSAMQKEPPS